MATFNNAHHESGGVVLFNGELILLFSENVNLTVPERNENETGKLYLTTHRMIFINNSMSRNLKSLSIPFYTMQDLKLEQPIFGANYIQGKATEAVSNKKFSFKLKFSHGGATEYGQALSNAARAVQNMTRQSGGFQPPPPPYTNTASQYYQAPPNVYQPAYNCGFALPNDIFNQPPPAGFIYASEAPPPYPGLNNPSDSKQSGGYPPQQSQSGYPPQQQQYGGYPPQQQPGGYPTQQQPGGYPTQQQPGGYPTQQQPGGYSSQQQQGGYPSQQQQGGYPSQQQQGGYPSQPGFAGGMPPGYPGPQQQQQQAFGGGYPSQPGFAPQSNPTTTNEQHQQSSMYPRLDDFPSAPPSAPPPPQ